MTTLSTFESSHKANVITRAFRGLFSLVQIVVFVAVSITAAQLYILNVAAVDSNLRLQAIVDKQALMLAEQELLLKQAAAYREENCLAKSFGKATDFVKDTVKSVVSYVKD